MNSENYSSLKNFLRSENKGLNPFLQAVNKNFSFNKYPKNNIILEDKDIRCPICLKLVFYPVKPNVCLHVYCKRCIQLWCKTKFTCPLCRKNFQYLEKINKNDTNYGFQGNLFV
jgi:SUMO ligase MMS21 Smc5/6 complex component